MSACKWAVLLLKRQAAEHICGSLMSILGCVQHNQGSHAPPSPGRQGHLKSLGFFGLWPTLSVELWAHMLGDSLIKHENTIYIYIQKSTWFGAVYIRKMFQGD